KATSEAGYRAGEDVLLAVDVAASQVYRDGLYFVDGRLIEGSKLLELYVNLIDEFPIASIEDPFAEDHPQYFRGLKVILKARALVIGDDLTVTNAS
ncbi:MAG: hypothetical protein QW489_01865, partial [Sulfolobales archaeon]